MENPITPMFVTRIIRAW